MATSTKRRTKTRQLTEAELRDTKAQIRKSKKEGMWIPVNDVLKRKMKREYRDRLAIRGGE